MPIERRPWPLPGSPLAVALITALIAAALLALAGAMAAARFDALVETNLRADIALDRRSLLAELDRLRVVAVIDAVDQRVVGHRDSGRPGLYLVADASGRRVAGNLAQWPSGLPRAVGWHWLRLPDAATGRALVHLERVAGGWWLAIGRPMGPYDALRRDLAWLAAGLALTILAAAVLVALAAERRGRREVAAMNAVLAAFRNGTLGQRIEDRQSLSDPGRRTLAAAIDATMAHAERLLGGMQRLSESVAHELKSPLSRMRHLLEADDRDGALVELDAGLHLVDALLDISANETGINSGARVCDLAPLVEQAGALYGDVAEAAGVALVVEAAPGVALVNPDLITRALANLIDNAVRHTPAGGHVHVSSRTLTTGAVEVAVADTGGGPPAASLADLAARARPGYRADGTRSSGLGLRLVQAIALRHGAKIQLTWHDPGHRIALELVPAAQS